MKPSPVPNLGKTVGFTAHPDDLFFAAAGLLYYLWTLFGIRVQSICATLGTGYDPDATDAELEKIGIMRQEEDERALARVGVTTIRYLEHQFAALIRDGNLVKVDFTWAVRLIVSILAEIQPDTVITFNPFDGLTGHPDHKTIGRWVTMAVRLAKRRGLISPNVRLIYIAPTPRYLRLVVPKLRKLKAIYGLTLVKPRYPLFIDLLLSGKALDTKWAGLEDYESQVEHLFRDRGKQDLRPWVENEGFVLADV